MTRDSPAAEIVFVRVADAVRVPYFDLHPGYMYPFRQIAFRVRVKITRFPEVASEATDGFRPFYGRVLSQTPTSIHIEHGCVR